MSNVYCEGRISLFSPGSHALFQPFGQVVVFCLTFEQMKQFPRIGIIILVKEILYEHQAGKGSRVFQYEFFGFTF